MSTQINSAIIHSNGSYSHFQMGTSFALALTIKLVYFDIDIFFWICHLSAVFFNISRDNVLY